MLGSTRQIIAKRFVLYVSLPLFLIFVNPESSPLALLVVPFILLFVIIFTLIRDILGKLQMRLSGKQSVIVAGTCSALPVMILVFQSIHQLTVRDLLSALALVIAVVFYITKAKFI